MTDFRSISHLAPEMALIAGVGLLYLAGSVGDSELGGLTTRAILVQGGILCLAYSGAAWRGKPARLRLALVPAERPLSPSGIAAAILGLVGLSWGLNWLLIISGMRETSILNDFEQYLGSQRGIGVVYSLLGMAVLPALAEELLFRGFLLGRLETHWGKTVALLASSVVFGAAHLDLAQGAAATVLGLYLGAIRLRTGSVHAPILCHMSNNTLAVLGPLLFATG